MRKRLLLLLITLCAALTQAHADIYLQKFDNPVPSSSKPEAYAPEGWGRIVDSFECWGDGPWYIAYKVKTSGGKDGAYLQAPRQRLPEESDEYEDYDHKDTYDLLVTPMLTGDISFWIKASISTSYAYAEIYECAESGEGYTRGELLRKVTISDMTTSTWSEVTMHLDKPCRLGLRLSAVNIDEFSGELPKPAASMAINSATAVDSKPLPSPDGITTVAYDVEIANTGGSAINPGDEGYSLSIEQYYNERKVVATVPVTTALAPGATTTVRVSADIKADTKTKCRFDIVENISGTRFTGSWFTIMPYTPEMRLCLKNGEEHTDISGPVCFGFTESAPVERVLTLMSDGGAPLEVTAISLPQGYTLSGATMPITLAPGQSQDFTVTLGTEVKGACGGEMTVSATGITGATYQLIGGVVGDGCYFTDFEQGIPANMLQLDPNKYGKLWETFDLPDAYGSDSGLGAKAAHCKGMAMLVTPRLRLAEGERITFNAAQISYSAVLKVYWSTDRVTWHEVLDIGGRDEYGESPKEHDTYFSNKHIDKKFSENYEFGQFSASGFPAGDLYIAFEAGNARLDNVLAGRPAPGAVDIIVEGHLHPDLATVNNPCKARIILRNLSAETVAAADYSVTLNVGDQERQFADLTDIAPGATVDYTIAYIPHATGQYPVSITVRAGETEITTPETILEVAGEEALVRHTAGTPDGSRSYRHPLATSYCHSASQAIYTADELGLTRGDEILKVTFSGYTISDKQAEYDLTLWLVNTTDKSVSAGTPHATDDIMPIWNGKWAPRFGGSLEEPVDILSITLHDGFIYTGDNLLVMLEATCVDFKSVYFISSAAGSYISRFADTEDDYKTTAWTAEQGRAVLNVYTAMDVPTISGTVTDSSGSPLQGVRLSLSSGEVLYTAESAADGTYTIAPVQHTLAYTLMAEADGYTPAEPFAVTFSGDDIIHDIMLLRQGETGIDDIEADSETGEYYNLQGIKVDGQLPAGIYLHRRGTRTVKVYVK